jgi:hypothetical protein
MAKKSEVKKKNTKIANHMREQYEEPMKIESPPPPKVPLNRDIKFLGEALVKEVNRINELELSIESLRLDLKRVMGRMGL